MVKPIMGNSVRRGNSHFGRELSSRVEPAGKESDFRLVAIRCAGLAEKFSVTADRFNVFVLAEHQAHRAADCAHGDGYTGGLGAGRAATHSTKRPSRGILSETGVASASGTDLRGFA